MFASHEEAAQSHTTMFNDLIIQAEELTGQVEALKETLRNMDYCDENWKMTCQAMHIAEVEAFSKYNEAQLHLQAANKHTNAVKYDKTGDAPYL